MDITLGGDRCERWLGLTSLNIWKAIPKSGMAFLRQK